MRIASGTFSGFDDKWPIRPSYALWIHDVLLLQNGFALIRTLPASVAAIEGSVQDADPEAVKGLGDNPLLFTYKLDNVVVMKMAVSTDYRTLSAGPFKEKNQ